MKRPRAAYIPSDVQEQVLKALPVKSLLRFRCVCKQWRSVIDDPHFVNLHRIASYRRPGGVKFLRGYEKKLKTSRQVLYRLVDLDGKTSQTENRYRGLNRHPSNLSSFSCGAQGVEGLVCDGYAVCNPTTRKRFHLPLPNLLGHRMVRWGLGFDSETSEYKVVHLLWDQKGWGRKVCVRVLTLGTNAWRNIDTAAVPVEALELPIGYGVYAQNKIFFPVETYYNSYAGLLVVWVGEERLQYVDLPQGMDTSKWRTTIEFGNTIALMPQGFTFYSYKIDRSKFEVWILCDVQAQKWDRVVYEDETLFDWWRDNNVVCSMDGSAEEVLVEGPAEGRGLVARTTYYWDVKRMTMRKGPDHKGRDRIYTKHVETLFDPTLVKL